MDGISLELMSPRLLELNLEDSAGRQSLLAQRPALFAGYGDLDKLRYDFPLVLVEDGAGSGEEGAGQKEAAIAQRGGQVTAPEGDG